MRFYTILERNDSPKPLDAKVLLAHVLDTFPKGGLFMIFVPFWVPFGTLSVALGSL